MLNGNKRQSGLGLQALNFPLFFEVHRLLGKEYYEDISFA